jgi:hypothetical protein
MLIVNSLRMVLGDYCSTSNFRLADYPLGIPARVGAKACFNKHTVRVAIGRHIHAQALESMCPS